MTTVTPSRPVCADVLLSSSRIWLEAKDIMSENVVTIEPDRTMGEAADRMAGEGISCLVITEDQRVVGLLTERDFLRAVVAEGARAADASIRVFMTHPIQTITPNRSILDAGRLMEAQGLKRLPVLAKDTLVGIITQTDLIRALTHAGTQEDVSAIMTTSVRTISPEATVAEAAALMAREQLSCLVAFSGDSPVGLVTERDMLVKVTARRTVPTALQVREVMSYPVVSVSPSCSIFGAARTMDERRVHRLAVIDAGRLVGIVTQTDIFRTAKLRLQEEEAKGFQLLGEADSCIFIMDMDGVTTYVNPSFLRLFETDDPSPFVNQPFLPERFWVEPYQREPYASRRNRSHIDIEELALKTVTGQPLFVSVTATFVRDIHGRISGIQGILRDITARKLAERAMAVVNERLEKANRELKTMQSRIVQSEKLAAIGQLAAGVAHEMNTPVGFVMSNLQTLGKYLGRMRRLIDAYDGLATTIAGESSSVLQDAWAAVQTWRKTEKIDFAIDDVPGLIAESREGLDRVTAIVQNLRDFSRIDQAENFDAYQINNGIEATLLVAQHEIGPDIEVIRNLGSIPPVPCNAGQINQVILVLVVNAAQALRDQTERPATGHITIHTFADNGWVCCAISDDGPGIAVDHRSRIFEPFFTTKPVGKGTGLGLSAAYDIVVHKHQGELLVDSTVGQGTTFTLRLPLSVNDEES